MIKKRIKVLIVTDFFYPHWTGISQSIYNLTKLLNKKIDFTVLTVRYHKGLNKYENIDGVKIIREKYLFSFSRVKYSISLVSKFLLIVKNYDVIFLNSPLSNVLPISLISKLFKKKLIIFHQGDLILRTGFFNWIIERVFDLSTLISLRLANKVSTYNRDYAENSRLLKYFLKKFTPLLMPIILSPDISIKNSKLHKLAQLKKNKISLFGFAGRFVHEKGFDILFEAIADVMKKLPHAHFAFAGETNIGYEKFFQENIDKFKKIKKDVTLLGLLNKHEMRYFYKLIDYIIIPSRSDCFNLIQAESMLSGRPSIVSDIPGARFLVQQTNFGLIFNKGDFKDLSNKIVQAVNQKKQLLLNYNNLLKFLDLNKHADTIRKFIEN